VDWAEATKGCGWAGRGPLLSRRAVHPLTDKACPEGFAKAHEFLSGLTQSFALSAERCILVPGNHDVTQPDDTYVVRQDSKGLREEEWFAAGLAILARNPDKQRAGFHPEAVAHALAQAEQQKEIAIQSGQPNNKLIGSAGLNQQSIVFHSIDCRQLPGRQPR
jgi:hypothetical protein